MKPINQQTPGPVSLDSSETLTAQTKPQRWIATVKAHENHAEQLATGQLLAASYSAFDAAARELGVDAVELAKSLDLASVIRYALDYSQINTRAHSVGDVGRTDQLQAARRTLAPLAKLMNVEIGA